MDTNDMCVKFIDKTDINEPTKREGFRAYKLNSFTLQGLNQREFFLLDLVMIWSILFM